MQNPDSAHHQLIHEAMQNTADVPVDFIKKPDEVKQIPDADIEHIKEAMRMDNVVRNLGNTVLGLRESASKDKLTNTGSKTAGLEHIQNLIDGGKGLEVFFLDLDNFKTVNDTLGHDTGDKTLIALAGAMLGSLREGESLFRFGGDEFVVVKDKSIVQERRVRQEVVEADERVSKDRRQVDASEEVEGFSQRVSSAFTSGVTELETLLGKKLSLNLGLSVGHAEHKDNQTIDELLHEADVDMYRNKAKQKQEAPTPSEVLVS